MTPLEAVLKIKQLFEDAGAAMPPAPPAEPVLPVEAAKEYELKVGGKVMIDKLEVGGLATVPGEDGSPKPAPAGEHELIDGLTITVDETGAITEVEAPEPAPAAPVTDEDMKKAAEKFAVGTPEQRLANLEIIAKALMESAFGWRIKEAEEKANIDAAIQVYKAGFESQIKEQEAKFGKAISDLSDVIVGLINTPSASATENPKDKFNAHTESKDEKIKRFLDLAKNLKK